jgi:hypothetical protein
MATERKRTMAYLIGYLCRCGEAAHFEKPEECPQRDEVWLCGCGSGKSAYRIPTKEDGFKFVCMDCDLKRIIHRLFEDGVNVFLDRDGEQDLFTRVAKQLPINSMATIKEVDNAIRDWRLDHEHLHRNLAIMSQEIMHVVELGSTFFPVATVMTSDEHRRFYTELLHNSKKTLLHEEAYDNKIYSTYKCYVPQITYKWYIATWRKPV